MDENLRKILLSLGESFNIRVTPKASSARIAIQGGAIRIYVAAPPVDGEANEAVITLLAKAMGLPKSALTIVSGQTSRYKRIRVSR